MLLSMTMMWDLLRLSLNGLMNEGQPLENNSKKDKNNLKSRKTLQEQKIKKTTKAFPSNKNKLKICSISSSLTLIMSINGSSKEYSM